MHIINFIINYIYLYIYTRYNPPSFWPLGRQELLLRKLTTSCLGLKFSTDRVTLRQQSYIPYQQ